MLEVSGWCSCYLCNAHEWAGTAWKQRSEGLFCSENSGSFVTGGVYQLGVLLVLHVDCGRPEIAIVLNAYRRAVLR